jgi:hypothetical protein
MFAFGELVLLCLAVGQGQALDMLTYCWLCILSVACPLVMLLPL